ncbi:hypothetical protein FNV43_RR05994 [Rhamnella rubrinervis]|uniref:Uncharacterized protein n=1 Tax=Rhamnella rubrinervis TaxID=2594499 RepID=A0A8K0MLJ7_9ROSA|nr:hypothetical protein FNV43_RR05994 [Rhamnella rubrinervis]
MGEEEEKKKKRVVVESLGWLTESSIMPKKHRAIAGVGASSIMDLKAQLYQSQEDSKKSKELSGADIQFHRAKKKIVPNDSFSAKNSGVDARALKDKLELKAVKDGSASYAALERKAELYDKLARGELSDEEENEKYCVDFLARGLSRMNCSRHNNMMVLLLYHRKMKMSDLLDFDYIRACVMIISAADFFREVHEEANQAREKVSELRLRRQEQVAARREKLKQAYLRKQLEKLKAASSTEKT